MPGDNDTGERRIRYIERRVDDHDEKYGKIMTAVSRIETAVEKVEEHVKRIDARQWEERPSAQMTIPHAAPTPSRTSVRPEFKQVGAMGAIVVLVQLVAELVRFIVAPQPTATVPIQVPARSQVAAQEAQK
jgi:predicted TIM-barrel fold metal-dependent hydrolase